MSADASTTDRSEEGDVSAMKVGGFDLGIGCVDLDGTKSFAGKMSRQGPADAPRVHDNTYDAEFVAAANGVFEGDHVIVQTRPFEAAGPDLDRKKVIAATNQMAASTAGGLTLPVDWRRPHGPRTVDDPVALGSAQDRSVLFESVNSVFEIVGDPSMPWYCWPGDNDAWSEPIPTNFF